MKIHMIIIVIILIILCIGIIFIMQEKQESYYGILENGQYRIVKPLYVSGNNGRINLYSEEFEINEQ